MTAHLLSGLVQARIIAMMLAHPHVLPAAHRKPWSRRIQREGLLIEMVSRGRRRPLLRRGGRAAGAVSLRSTQRRRQCSAETCESFLGDQR